MRRWDGITDSMDMSLSMLQELVMEETGGLQSMGHKESDMTEQLTLALHFHYRMKEKIRIKKLKH